MRLVAYPALMQLRYSLASISRQLDFVLTVQLTVLFIKLLKKIGTPTLGNTYLFTPLLLVQLWLLL